jgi:hypothetical protein
LAKQKKIEELNKNYRDAESCDSELFSEQRSNILLVAGEHYNRKNSAFWNRVRDSKDLSSDQKLRLTKNHIYKISKVRKNLILAHASGVKVLPNNENEIQDQKAAELNQAVWSYYKSKSNFRKKINQFVSDFFDIGEVCAKIFWDDTKGEVVGYEQELDENGEPVIDENGKPVSSGRAIFSGELVIERFLAMNLLRAPEAKTMEESPYLIYRKVVSYEDVEAMCAGDEDKLKMIKGGKDETYFVFDSNKQKYDKDKGVVTLREHYYRPCPEYPDGYFYIAVEQGILFEGPIPYGIFPIVYEGHDEVPTTPRHRSPLKQLRPWQIEINRAASKIAEHQVTLGDDKLVVQSGAKVTSGSILPGVRSIQVSGMAPTILPGRSGDQYFAYVQGQISEMYQAAMVPEDMEEKGDQDAWSSLWKAVRNKKKFILDSEKFEGFLVNLCKTYLDLQRNYLDESAVIPMIGRSEAVNIAEFKATGPQSFMIRVEPASDDLETVMGKQLMFNHILQYSSAQLDKESIGRIIRAMPMGNNEEAFKDFTLDYDRATNIILALDRGQEVMPNKYDNEPYIVKRLTARMGQSDFTSLDPQIQQNYDNMVNLFSEMQAKKAQELKAMQADFIPTDGAMIKVAWYIKDPKNPSRSIQATLPASSINWLVQRLSEQGSAQDQLQMNGQGSADVVQNFNELSAGSGEQQTQASEAPQGTPMTPNQEMLSRLQGVLQ